MMDKRKSHEEMEAILRSLNDQNAELEAMDDDFAAVIRKDVTANQLGTYETLFRVATKIDFEKIGQEVATSANANNYEIINTYETQKEALRAVQEMASRAISMSPNSFDDIMNLLEEKEAVLKTAMPEEEYGVAKHLEKTKKEYEKLSSAWPIPRSFDDENEEFYIDVRGLHESVVEEERGLTTEEAQAKILSYLEDHAGEVVSAKELSSHLFGRYGQKNKKKVLGLLNSGSEFYKSIPEELGLNIQQGSRKVKRYDPKTQDYIKAPGRGERIYRTYLDDDFATSGSETQIGDDIIIEKWEAQPEDGEMLLAEESDSLLEATTEALGRKEIKAREADAKIEKMRKKLRTNGFKEEVLSRIDRLIKADGLFYEESPTRGFVQRPGSGVPPSVGTDTFYQKLEGFEFITSEQCRNYEISRFDLVIGYAMGSEKKVGKYLKPKHPYRQAAEEIVLEAIDEKLAEKPVEQE